MASRKQQKEQARAARMASEQAAAAKAGQTRRLQIFAGITAIAVIVIAVVIVIAGGSGGSPKPVTVIPGHLKHNPQIRRVDAAVARELGGIPQRGVVLGNPHAKVTMVYFGDLQCPVCAAMTMGTSYDGSADGGLPQFIANHVRTGDANLVYRSMCTATCNDYQNGQSIFTGQQTAAYAAGRQGKFWNFAETFYREQGAEGSGYVTPAYIRAIAQQVPTLNLVTWTTDRADKTLSAQVAADQALASKLGLGGTPTLILKGPKGEQVVSGFPTYSSIQSTYRAVT